MKKAFIILSVCIALSSGSCNVVSAQDVDYEQTVMIVDLRLTQFVNDMNSLMQLSLFVRLCLMDVLRVE